MELNQNQMSAYGNNSNSSAQDDILMFHKLNELLNV